MNDTIDIVKALLELDFICIDVDKKDTYIYKMLNDLILFIEKVSKVEALLGLYRECNKEGVFWLEIQQRIAQLEKELEELK